MMLLKSVCQALQARGDWSNSPNGVQAGNGLGNRNRESNARGLWRQCSPTGRSLIFCGRNTRRQPRVRLGHPPLDKTGSLFQPLAHAARRLIEARKRGRGRAHTAQGQCKTRQGRAVGLGDRTAGRVMQGGIHKQMRAQISLQKFMARHQPVVSRMRLPAPGFSPSASIAQCLRRRNKYRARRCNPPGANNGQSSRQTGLPSTPEETRPEQAQQTPGASSSFVSALEEERVFGAWDKSIASGKTTAVALAPAHCKRRSVSRVVARAIRACRRTRRTWGFIKLA